MNDMSRPQPRLQPRQPNSAVRLSEDIGDVLSAIRRLIAEDEALDYARDSLQRTEPGLQATADTAEALADRFGGPSALARQMAQQGAGFRERRLSDPAIAPADDHPVAPIRPRLVAAQPPHAPAPRVAVSNLIASRDTPPRRNIEIAAPVSIQSMAPLRLREADRVAEDFDPFSSAPECPDAVADAADLRPTPYPAFDHFVASPALPAADADEDGDDFAEAFDAKARMRPEPLVAVQPQHADAPEAGEVPSTPATDAPEPQGEGRFWDAYVRTDADWRDAPGDDEIAAQNDAADEIAALTEPVEIVTIGAPATHIAAAEAAEVELIDDAQPRAFGLSIPAYPADPAPEADQTAEARDAGPAVPSAVSDAMDTIASDLPQLDQPDAGASEQPSGPAVEQPQDTAEAIVEALLAEQANVAEASVREVIRELIQEELHGELGQRFARNLRAVIRREVAAAIDDHLERL